MPTGAAILRELIQTIEEERPMTLGKGRAEAIGDRDIALLADTIGCHPADLEAIAIVESNGFGWFKDGRMKILFEKHWFYRNLDDGAKRNTAVKAGLARKAWIAPKDGGYKDQSNADARYRLLARAIEIDEEAALRSISMGKFQIMGFNYALCGFVSAKHMWAQFLDSEANQLRALARFLDGKDLWPALRSRDFATIEKIYNGGGLNGRYAARMAEEADRLRAGKWAGYETGQFAPQNGRDAPRPSPAPQPPKTPEPEPTSPAGGNTGILALLFAGIITGAVAFWEWLSSLPCDWLGIFCQ
ncbi:N-acetylmuramidase family protein [Chelativorans sp. AA-79]|uniref:N-acetylmuramidase family protein n=1 Tax=Chelativorans sp. AA-79 TaxID=3028735 RepID=UPI0023F80C33|nr:N-acetylmuramidase family protein [Chelativorans sp. AA-79]WEX10266.1 N-acetylmuramidase family protein [Chelativorans sp. AA-79]